MGALQGHVKAHPLLVFVVLAYAFSWTLVPFGGLLGCGPFLAAVLVLSLTEGRAGVRDLLRRMVRWRIGWGWYALAIGLPTAAAGLAAAWTIWLGAPMPSGTDLALWTEVPFTFVLVLVLPVFGPWEEPGFRGYALSRLSLHRTPLTAALLVGVIHVGFHVPLFLRGDIPASDMVFVMAAAVVFAWLVVGSGGSVLVAMVMHAANNAVSGEYVSPMFSGAYGEVLGWLRAGLWCLFAVAVVLAVGPGLRSARPALSAP